MNVRVCGTLVFLLIVCSFVCVEAVYTLPEDIEVEFTVPHYVIVGEPFKISALVENTGDTIASVTLELEVDGIPVDHIYSLVLQPGEVREVSFSPLVLSLQKSYNISINNLAPKTTTALLAEGDLDGDGWENKYELTLGTDPGNSVQVPTKSMVLNLIVSKVNEYYRVEENERPSILEEIMLWVNVYFSKF